jgi:hypothetical protein
VAFENITNSEKSFLNRNPFTKLVDSSLKKLFWKTPDPVNCIGRRIWHVIVQYDLCAFILHPMRDGHWRKKTNDNVREL